MIRRFFTFSILCLNLCLLAYPQSKETPKKAARPKGDRTFSETKIVQGKVAEITASKLVIENDYGAKREINLDAKTKFLLATKKDVKASEMPIGLLVNVTFREVDNTATIVQEREKTKK